MEVAELNKIASENQPLINAVNVGWTIGVGILALIALFYKTVILYFKAKSNKPNTDPDPALCDDIRIKLDAAIILFLQNTENDRKMNQAIEDVAFLFREAKAKLSAEIADYLNNIMQDMSHHRHRDLISNQLNTEEGDKARSRCVDAYTRIVSLQTAAFFRPYIMGNKK